MPQRRHRLGFPPEACQFQGARERAGKHHLQGNKAIELAMLRFEDDTHAAATKDALDIVAEDLRQFEFCTEWSDSFSPGGNLGGKQVVDLEIDTLNFFPACADFLQEGMVVAA